MQTNNNKILICLSRQLLNEIGPVLVEKQVSRSFFIRESLRRNLHYYYRYEREPICFPRDHADFNCEKPSKDRGEICEVREPSFEDGPDTAGQPRPRFCRKSLCSLAQIALFSVIRCSHHQSRFYWLKEALRPSLRGQEASGTMARTLLGAPWSCVVLRVSERRYRTQWTPLGFRTGQNPSPPYDAAVV